MPIIAMEQQLVFFRQLYQVAGATASPRYVITLLFLKNSVFLNKSSSF